MNPPGRNCRSEQYDGAKGGVVPNMQFRRVMLLSGYFIASRIAGEIEYNMPLKLESLEQGLAFLAYACRDCVPIRPTPWLVQGRALQDHLPWVKSRREYEARPQCAVAKDWFRLAAKDLRVAAEAATPTDAVEIAFDGASLRIAYGERVLTWPTSGNAWPGPAKVRLAEMRLLPKRLQGDVVHFDIWEGRIGIGRMRFELIDAEPRAGGTP